MKKSNYVEFDAYYWQFNLSLAKKELESLFTEALKHEATTFEVDKSDAKKLISIASDLLCHGKNDIFRNLSQKVRSENKELTNKEELEQKILNAIALEMGKLVLYFKNLHKTLSPLKAVSLSLFFLTCLRQSQAIELKDQTQEISDPLSLDQAMSNLKNFLEQDFKRDDLKDDLQKGLIEGFSAKELQEIHNFKIQNRFNFTLNKKTALIACAVVLALVLFMF